MTDKPPVKYGVDHPDFDLTLGERLRVYLNGKLQEHVINYDSDKGIVERFIVTEDGEVVLDPDGESAAREKLYGDVIVEIDV